MNKQLIVLMPQVYLVQIYLTVSHLKQLAIQILMANQKSLKPDIQQFLEREFHILLNYLSLVQIYGQDLEINYMLMLVGDGRLDSNF